MCSYFVRNGISIILSCYSADQFLLVTWFFGKYRLSVLVILFNARVALAINFNFALVGITKWGKGPIEKYVVLNGGSCHILDIENDDDDDDDDD